MDYLSNTFEHMQDGANKTIEMSDRSIYTDGVENPEIRCKTQTTLHNTLSPVKTTARLTVAGDESYDNSSLNKSDTQYMSAQDDTIESARGSLGADASTSSKSKVAKHSMLAALSKLHKPVMFGGSASVWARSLDLDRLGNLHHRSSASRPEKRVTIVDARSEQEADLSGLTSKSSSNEAAGASRSRGEDLDHPAEDSRRFVASGAPSRLEARELDASGLLSKSYALESRSATRSKRCVDSNTSCETTSASIQSLEIREKVMVSGNEEASAAVDIRRGKHLSQRRPESSPQFGGSCWQKCFRSPKHKVKKQQ